MNVISLPSGMEPVVGGRFRLRIRAGIAGSLIPETMEGVRVRVFSATGDDLGMAVLHEVLVDDDENAWVEMELVQ